MTSRQANGRKLERALAERVSVFAGNEISGVGEVEVGLGSPISSDLLSYLGDHISAGETHYTSPRHGILELRRMIADQLAGIGAPFYEPVKSVAITAGVGEALLATLLGLDLGEGDVVATARREGKYQLLFRTMGLSFAHPPDDEDTKGLCKAVYRELAGDESANEELFRLSKEQNLPDIFNIGDTIGSIPVTDLPLVSSELTILMGSLDSLPGLDSFRVGFVAGPEIFLKRIMIWKQAFSICTAAPSQRAALFLLD